MSATIVAGSHPTSPTASRASLIIRDSTSNHWFGGNAWTNSSTDNEAATSIVYSNAKIWIACLAYGTAIWQAKSYKLIQDVRLGDEIMSLGWSPTKVTGVWTHAVKTVWRVHTKHFSVMATAEHPFITPGQRFVQLGNLYPGDSVGIHLDEKLTYTPILLKEKLDGEFMVYDIATDKGTYYADGFLVHNKPD
jgi:hypothetical protein